jgi:ABC-type sulfate/molybdate transport systems ATPase subunit
VILSSHLLADVVDVCDRVVIYYGGRVQAMGTMQELLATPDSVRLTMPVLSRETMERVLAIIRSEVATEKCQIDVPTQNLENYFLSVVQKAKLAEAETSGATSGNRVAAYLRGEAVVGTEGDKILERLTRPTAPVAPTVTVAPAAAPTMDLKKLEELTKPKAPAPEMEAPAAETIKPVDLEKANEKLSVAVGKPK